MHRFKRFVTALLLGALLAPGPALAQKKAKEKKKKKAEVQAVTAGGPTLQYDQFRRKVEIKVAEKREAQIDGLKKLLELGPAPNEVPDIKFRLAELFYEKSRFFFFRSQEGEEKASASKDPGVKDQLKAESKTQAKESQTWEKRAMDIYKEIRERYPKYERLPEVLFALGQSYWNAGKLDDAIGVYSELIQHFKDSPLVADAWLAFGEYYFNQADLNKALKAYELAATDKRSRVYGFALYKQAWCYYNLADWKKAMEKFRATVYYSQLANELAGENRIALGREATKDFVKTYANAGEATRSKFVLGDLVSDDDCKTGECRKLVEMLAGIWFDTGRFEESAHLYRELIVLDPNSTRNPFFQGRVVDLVSRSADKKATTRETRRLVEIYQQVKAKGANTPQAKTDLQDAETLAESTVRRLGQEWNREAKKTRQKPTYEFAKVMYADYLALFPASKFAYEMRFQLGDLFYKLEQFDEAAKAYEATVLADPKGKYLIEAANDNILAVEEHLKDLNLPRAPKAAGDKPLEIHPEKKRLIDACDRYVKFVPPEKAEKLISVMFKPAKIFYDHNQFEEAIKRFEVIILQAPQAEESEYAANLVIDVYNLREDWERLYETSSRYLKMAPLIENREKLKKDLDKASEYAKFKLVQILEERLKKEGGSMGPVAKAYEEFQAEFPKSENADKALYNASVAWDLAGEKDRANVLRQRLMDEYKDSDLRADVQYYIAKSFEERAEFAKAADLFEAFADAYPTDKRARDALYNAGVFLAGIGQVKHGNALRTKYLEKYGKQKGGEKEGAAIYFTMARDLERDSKFSDAAKAYEDFVKKFPNDEQIYEAMWRQAAIHREKKKEGWKAERIEDVLVATYRLRTKKGDKTPPIAADYASRIALNRLDQDFEKYTRLKLVRPSLKDPKPFKRSLDDKARAREQVIKAYTNIVTTYQQAYSTIGALNKIAQSWDNFIAVLLAVPCPSGLNDEQCGFFREGLGQYIEPARESAHKAYETCVLKSNELNVFTPDSTECVKALEKIAPDMFPPVLERKVPYTPRERSIDVRSNDLILRYDAPGVGEQAPPPSNLEARRGGEPEESER